ncbi:MAG: trypsin-like serine protease [Deltaproteobacteria bacterium]|nr:trypsin-like serine protease [Deltaproteobacteria bacterium]
MWFSAALAVAMAAAPPPIVNGTPTDDYPEVVLLRHTTADGSVAFVCTGTLVTPAAVLTAAHCLDEVEGYDLTQVRVFSGSVWTATAPERQASRWEMHPDYSVSDDGLQIEADLGLVWLDDPYTLDGYPINADPITADDVGTAFRYVGWGSSSDIANDQGYAKRVVDIPLVDLEGEFILANDGDNGGATCGGDSGGPAFELDEGRAVAIAAVHSFGRDDDATICAGSTSGDTRADLYLDWIVEATGAATDAAVAEEAGPSGDGGGKRDDAEPDDTATCGLPGGGRGAGLMLLAALTGLRRRR